MFGMFNIFNIHLIDNHIDLLIHHTNPSLNLKKMFNKIFSKKVIVPFFSGIGTVAIFDWIVFPGLTAADTLVNVLAGIIGFFTLLFVYYSLGIDTIISNYVNSDGLVDKNELKEAEQVVKEKSKTKRKPKTTK